MPNQTFVNEVKDQFQGMANEKDPAKKNIMFMKFIGYLSKLKKGGVSDGNQK